MPVQHSQHKKTAAKDQARVSESDAAQREGTTMLLQDNPVITTNRSKAKKRSVDQASDDSKLTASILETAIPGVPDVTDAVPPIAESGKDSRDVDEMNEANVDEDEAGLDSNGEKVRVGCIAITENGDTGAVVAVHGDAVVLRQLGGDTMYRGGYIAEQSNQLEITLEPEESGISIPKMCASTSLDDLKDCHEFGPAELMLEILASASKLADRVELLNGEYENEDYKNMGWGSWVLGRKADYYIGRLKENVASMLQEFISFRAFNPNGGALDEFEPPKSRTLTEVENREMINYVATVTKEIGLYRGRIAAFDMDSLSRTAALIALDDAKAAMGKMMIEAAD